jgi:ArsR family metal-binding transcriptional regulator
MSLDEMYLSGISLMRTYPCLAERGKIIVDGKPARSLVDIIPYLATLPGLIAYNPDAPTLTFRRRPGFLTFYANRVTITQVRDVDEGVALLAALTEAINATWEHRQELTAVTHHRRRPGPLDVYALLPQTNCQQCGEATCMAFAFGLIQYNRAVAECPALAQDPAFAGRRNTLTGML